MNKWDKETDVVVIGYGGAGAVAAVTAAEEGAKVILVEKAPEPGGNTRTSAGGMRVCDDPVKGVEYLKAMGLGTIGDEMAELYAKVWGQMIPWLKGHGARLVLSEKPPRLTFPGADAFHHVAHPVSPEGYPIGCGIDLFNFLSGLVRDRGIEVLVETPARKLVQKAGTREILGVIAEREGKEMAIKARRAVILACGGFEASPELLATYVEAAPLPIYFSGTPYNTGDGLKMAMDAGADLWHMNGIEWAIQGLKVPDFPAAFWISPPDWGWINVNRYGQRFRDESDTYFHTNNRPEVFRFRKASTEWPNHPWYMIFDEQTRRKGSMIMTKLEENRAPFITYNITSGLYRPSPDNRREIEKGWIRQAPTIEELAAQIGIDRAGLLKTISDYNGYCRSASRLDPEFRRRSDTLRPIDTPPYYSMECAMNMINTQGGPRRNTCGQVMNPFGRPIPRLYAGGELGSIWGYFYTGASNISECIISGIIAGKTAAGEAPWD